MTGFAAIILLATLLGNVKFSHSRHLTASSGAALCASVCPSPVLLKTIKPGSPVSYACTAATAAGGAIGYQLSNGAATCTISDGSQSVVTETYNCLCKDASQTQGLDLPGTSGGCADSCSKSLDDEVGKPVGTAGSYGCLAATEVGITNRFGHLTSGNVCTYAVDGAAQSSSQFSCVCLFSPGLAPVSTTQQIQPLVAAATAG